MSDFYVSLNRATCSQFLLSLTGFKFGFCTLRCPPVLEKFDL